MLDRILRMMAEEPARVRGAVLAVLVVVADQLDELLDLFGVDESAVLGFDLGWVGDNQAAVSKALTLLGLVVLVMFGRLSVRDVVTPVRSIEDRSAVEPVWRSDGGE